jgi:1-acyl-sn-glycerol-3-phosphate acyltransferase
VCIRVAVARVILSHMPLTAGEIGRRLVRALARVYYSPIEIEPLDKLRGGSSLLIVANHANSLLDPVILGIAAQRPVRFVAKDPLFKVPVLGRAMHALGMIPAYRAVDSEAAGAERIKRNLASLGAGAAALARGDAVGIFPEGKSHDELRVEPLKSGAARLAIQAVQLEGCDRLRVVPVGINYERKEKFRSAVWVRVGEPVDVKAWLARHAGDERKAMRALTAEIDQRLKSLVIHLDEKAWAPLLEGIETLLGGAEASDSPADALLRRQHIASAINYFHATDRTRAEAAATHVSRFRERLDRLGLRAGRLPVLRFEIGRVSWRLLRDFAFLMIGFVVAAAATVHHLVPFVIVRTAAARLQAPGRTTVSLMRLSVGLPVYVAWYAFSWWILARLVSPWVASAWLALMPFAGVFALSYWPRAWALARFWWREAVLLIDRSQWAELRFEQNRVQALVDEFAAEYARIAPPGEKIE